jgi:hypothetical protein
LALFALSATSALAATSERTSAVTSLFTAVSGSRAATSTNQFAQGDLVVSLAGLSSGDAEGSPNNIVLTVNALPNTAVDLLSWNVSLSTIGASWLSEATILISNSAGDGVFFSPGFGDDFSGSGSYADSASLAALGLSFDVLSDGKLYMELFESFDDISGGADANYTAGNITFGGIAAVPEPATWGLMAFGALLAAGAARRRAR